MLSGEMIEAMFEKREIRIESREILAVAFIYETLPATSVWLGPGSDPYFVSGEDQETRHHRFVLTKILPSYQPHIIPAHLKIVPKTLITGRRYNFNDELCVSLANFTLARMLADILNKNIMQFKLKDMRCSAISISGNSIATGEARIALFAR